MDEMSEGIVTDALAQALLDGASLQETLAEALLVDEDAIEVDREDFCTLHEKYPGCRDVGFVFTIWVGDEKRTFSIAVKREA